MFTGKMYCKDIIQRNITHREEICGDNREKWGKDNHYSFTCLIIKNIIFFYPINVTQAFRFYLIFTNLIFFMI